MTKAFLIHVPSEIENSELQELAVDLCKSINKNTQFKAGKVSLRRSADTFLTIELTEGD